MELIALRMGFYDNRRVRPGQRFHFKGQKPPKWAAPVEDVEIRPTGTPVLKGEKAKAPIGDTKPAEAQAASKRKTGGVNETPLA